MFENIMKFFKKSNKKENNAASNSKEAAKERLHLVLMQDRANVSADFLELMKQEIIEVIKKYIDVDESAIDVRLTNKENSDGTNGAPALYANIPILNIKNESRKLETKKDKSEEIRNKADKELTDKKENSETEQTTETSKKIEKELEDEQIKKTQKIESNITDKISKEENNKESEIKDKEKISTKEEIKSEN